MPWKVLMYSMQGSLWYEFYDSHFETVLPYLAVLNLLLKFIPQWSLHGVRRDLPWHLLFGIKWWRGHARMIQMRLSIAISHQIRRRFLNMTFQLTKPSPLIPLIHNFHRNFFKILIHTLYPGCFDVQCQKDVLKEQLYWVSIGWWFGVAEVSFYIQIPRRFWNSVIEDYKPESHGK